MKSLYCSPISIEALEAVFQARAKGWDVNLTCSVGQVGPGAYTGFERDVFVEVYRRFERQYETSPKVERDHLGRGGEDIEAWCKADHECGVFDSCMLHIFEPMLLPGYNFEWQIGPGEDSSRKINPEIWGGGPAWASFPTGCLIDSLTNVAAVAPETWPVLPPGIKMRGHNCDYLTDAQLAGISMLCDGINIAPQLGTIQSCLYLAVARSYALPIKDWEWAVMTDEKSTKRWCHYQHQAMQGAGHYHYDQLAWRNTVRDSIVKGLVGMITHWAEIIGCK